MSLIEWNNFVFILIEIDKSESESESRTQSVTGAHTLTKPDFPFLIRVLSFLSFRYWAAVKSSRWTKKKLSAFEKRKHFYDYFH